MSDAPTEIPPTAPERPNEPLVQNFATIPKRFWADRVQRAAKDPSRPLSKVDDDGLEVQWLYSPDDALAADPGGIPGQGPFVRGTRVGTAWDIRQEHAHPAPLTANKQLLEDLVGGVTSFTLRFDATAREARPLGDDGFEAGRGEHGIAISSVDDLETVLEGVYPDLAPVVLDAGAAAIPAAALLRALWERRELDLTAIRGSFGIDPLGTLAAEGHLLDDPAAAVTLAGQIAAQTATETPNVQALRVDTRAYVGAGATPALELAIAASTGAAYLRAAVAAGLSPAHAAAQIEFQLTAGQVQFQEIAKLRAFRRIWARILEASGVPAEGQRSPLYARAADRMLSEVDPWTNMLRGTTSLFAAAVGGADGATVAAFDALLGEPSTLGRRVARNTQIILLEESGLARVADPAGGSWYVEQRSDQLARAAWEHLQRLEGAGGIATALADGSLATELATLAEARTDQLARRKRELTGVNTFPLLGDEGLEEVEPVDLPELAKRDRAARLERPPVDGLDTAAADAAAPTLAQITALAAAGARIDELAPLIHGTPHTATPLAISRDAAPFEALRATAGDEARVLLAPVGPLAATVNVVTWAKNYFAVAGIEGVLPTESEDPVELARSGDFAVAVLCPGKGVEDETAAEVVTALREAGVGHIVLAASKDDRAEALGADGAVRDGIDMVDALARIQTLITTAEQDA
jgi:methylmalonyl-CoA mutase